MFWWYLGTCSDREVFDFKFLWVLLSFTYVWSFLLKDSLIDFGTHFEIHCERGDWILDASRTSFEF